MKSLTRWNKAGWAAFPSVLQKSSLTSSSPKPFHLSEEKSWLQPFTDDWQLLQLLQAWLTQKQIKTPPCCHLKCSRLLPQLNSSCIKMWWGSHPALSTSDTRELWRPCWCVRYSCFHWGQHLSNSPLQLYLRIMKSQLQSAWWSRSFQPRAVRKQESHHAGVCLRVSAKCLFSLIAECKNFKRNQEIKFWIRISSVC